MADLSASDPYLDFLSAEGPAPILHRLRVDGPVHHVSSLGFWFVTRHDDVKRLYHDPEHVTADRRVWERFEPRPAGSMLRWVDDAGLMALGPESHARTRRIVASAFTPRAIRRMKQQIREVVERFAAPLRGRPGEILDLLSGLTKLESMLDVVLDIAPPGSRVRDDLRRFQDMGLYPRPLNFPVEIAEVSR